MPSPRTPWSVRSKRELERWFAWQSELAEDAARAQRDGGVDVAFVGDSIFESFRGCVCDSITITRSDV